MVIRYVVGLICLVGLGSGSFLIYGMSNQSGENACEELVDDCDSLFGGFSAGTSNSNESESPAAPSIISDASILEKQQEQDLSEPNETSSTSTLAKAASSLDTLRQDEEVSTVETQPSKSNSLSNFRVNTTSTTSTSIKGTSQSSSAASDTTAIATTVIETSSSTTTSSTTPSQPITQTFDLLSGGSLLPVDNVCTLYTRNDDSTTISGYIQIESNYNSGLRWGVDLEPYKEFTYVFATPEDFNFRPFAKQAAISLETAKITCTPITADSTWPNQPSRYYG